MTVSHPLSFTISALLKSCPLIWVCLMFSHDHTAVVTVLRKRQLSWCASPVLPMGVGGVTVHPQDVSLNGLVKAMSARTFHSDFPLLLLNILKPWKYSVSAFALVH